MSQNKTQPASSLPKKDWLNNLSDALYGTNSVVNTCDFCGNRIIGQVHSVVDENFNLQPGLKQCSLCKYGEPE